MAKFNKRYFFIFSFISIGLQFGCGNKSELIENEWRIYKSSISVEDYSTAINTIHRIITLDSNEFSLYDTLANLYFKQNRYNSANIIAKKALKYTYDLNTLEIAAKSSKYLGKNDEAFDYYKLLFKAKPTDVPSLYEMGLHYTNSEFQDSALYYVNLVIVNPNSEKLILIQYLGDRGQQRIPYKSAAYNTILSWQSTPFL